MKDTPKNPNMHITNYLDWFLKRKTPQFAVMIKGSWGCGKTHFIKEYIKKYSIFKSIFFNYNLPIYVSLHGITSIKQINLNIWKEILSPFVIILLLFLFGRLCVFYCNLIDLLTSNILKTFLVDTAFLGAVFFIIWMVFRHKLMKYVVKDYFIVFDDFERAQMNKAELLGFINTFVEHYGTHVIIIADEDKLFNKIEMITNSQNNEKNGDDKNKYDDYFSYLKIREKVIGKIFQFKKADEIVLNNLIRGISSQSKSVNILKEYLLENEMFFNNLLDKVKENNTDSKPDVHNLTNYRAVQYCFRELEYYYDNVNIKNPKEISEKTRKDKMGHIIERLIFSIFNKKYVTFISGTQKESSPEQTLCNGLDDLSQSPFILPNEINLQISSEKKLNLTLLNNSIEQYLKGKSPLSILSNWTDLDDELLKSGFAGMKTDLINYRYIFPEEIKQVISLRIMFAEIMGNETKEEIKLQMKKYMDDLYDNKSFSELNFNPKEVFYEDFSSKNTDENELFNYLHDKICNYCSPIKLYPELLNYISKNKSHKTFYSWFIGNLAFDMYSNQDPQQLFDKIKENSLTEISLKLHILIKRLNKQNIQITEKDFWMKLSKCFKNFAGNFPYKDQYNKRLRFNLAAKEIDEKLTKKRLSKEENEEVKNG